MQEERELLSRQQDAMREHAGPRELRTYPRIPSVKKKNIFNSPLNGKSLSLQLKGKYYVQALSAA